MDQIREWRRHLLLRVHPFLVLLSAIPLFKYVLAVQLFALIIAFVPPIADLFFLVPISLFRLHLWRLLTNIFVEPNLIVMLWSAYCFYQFLVFIAPNWPLPEVLKYALVVQFGSLLSIVLSALFLYMFAGLLHPFYFAQTGGTSALAMAALIALKQFLPDTVLLTTPVGRLKNGHLPFLFLLLSFPFWLFGLLRGTVPFQLIFSAQISWTYLRFFQSRGGMPEPMVGDRSEHFTWASLFPRRVQPLATIIGRLTFRSLRRFGVLNWVMRRERLAHIEEETIQMEALECVKVNDATTAVLAPGSWDAERRRQKALRMLNERLAATVVGGSRGTSPAPSSKNNIIGHLNSGRTDTEPYRLPPAEEGIMPMTHEAEEEAGEESYSERDRRIVAGAMEDDENSNNGGGRNSREAVPTTLETRRC